MLKAKDIMTYDVTTISPEATLVDAIELLLAKEISGMPVVDETGKIIGLISEKDVINFAFSGHLHNTKVREAMSTELTCFSSDTSIDKIALAIGQYQFRRVPIIEEGKPIGIISRRDILRIALKLGHLD